MKLDVSKQIPLDSYFSYLPVAEGVYRILLDRQYCNGDLIIGETRAALIDCGMGFGDLPKAVRMLTDKPLLILNTHCHVDHIGGNAQFHQPVYMGEEDIPSAQAVDYASFRRPLIADRIRQRGESSVQGMDLEEFYHRGPGELIPCREGDVFDLGGKTLTAYAVPGHSRGGRAYYLKENKFLYTGDAVFACTLCFGRGSSPRKQFADSLRKMLAMPFLAVFSGHYVEPFDHAFIEHALYTAENAVFDTGIPLPNPIDPRARVCFAPGDWPEEKYIERIKNGDHGLDNQVWAIVLSTPE